MDSETNRHLADIKRELENIDRKIGGTGSAFVRGIVWGAGYIIGAALIIVVIGWILNIIGVIPAFQNQVNDFRQVLENVSHPSNR